ncbi:precorrin-3B synthase [Streptomyces palmae]|nr:precorrin-3B synthase [Streptomyces palmae]
MPPTPLSADAPYPARLPAVSRDRGDACPGALRLHAADDGALARIRLPAGLLTSHQAEVLALAAEELGDGRLDLTSRGNVQLRGLPADCGAGLGDRLRAAGLLPSDRHERARNIVASPLAGLDGHGYGQVRDWARELDGLLCAESDTVHLSGRFLFALDDGRGDMSALGADVTLIATPGPQAVLRVGGVAAAPETAGAPVASGVPEDRDGTPECALLVPAEEGPRAAVLAALEFLAAVRESGTGVWRVRELPPRHAVSARRLAGRLAEAGVPAAPAGSAAGAGPTPVRPAGAPAIGLLEGPDGGCALSALAPLGRLTSAQWRLLARTAARHGTDELRMTPWRGVVLPGLARGDGRARLAELAAAGLVVDAGSPWHGVSACTGRPGCAKSLSDVRADAARAGRGTPGGLPVHWSGCERRCGHPGTGHWVDVLSEGDGYRISVRGEPARPAQVVTAEQAADAVAAARGTT